MVLKIVFVLTILGLQCVHGNGKLVDVTEPQKKIAEDPLGSSGIKPRPKRNPAVSTEYESTSRKQPGKSTTESMQEYLNIIEHYLPEIREHVQNIQKQFPGSKRDKGKYESDRDESYDNDYSERRQDLDMDNQNYNEEDDYYPAATENNEVRNGTYTYRQGIINETFTPGNPQLSRPETSWKFDKSSRMEPMKNLNNFGYKKIGISNYNFNPNNMNMNGFIPGRDFFKPSGNDANDSGISSRCDGCRKSIQRCDLDNIPVKPLVININNDCLSTPSERLMNRFPFQSRGHNRPFKFNQPAQLSPKYRPPFNSRDMSQFFFN